MGDSVFRAVELIFKSSRTTAFTGAGISVESGIPPFRGENGLWAKYDPGFLDIDFFFQQPEKSWVIIKEIFYDFFNRANPNDAHNGLTELQEHNLLTTVITQNIDYLHQKAGSKAVYEFHGNSQFLSCTKCQQRYSAQEIDLDNLPPRCGKCSAVLKPDFVFFGEPIPQKPYRQSYYEAQHSDLFLLIGTTGEVMPACMFPYMAKQQGAKIIEINTNPSHYTNSITDIFLQGKATEKMNELINGMNFN